MFFVKNFVIVLLISSQILLLDARRSLNIGRLTRTRNRNTGVNSRRRGTAHNEGSLGTLPTKPSIGGHGAPKSDINNGPLGPPPPYPGLENRPVQKKNVPPAYYPNNAYPPSYSQSVGGHGRGYPYVNGPAGNPSQGGMYYPSQSSNSPSNLYNPAMGTMYGANYGYRDRGGFGLGGVLTGLAVLNLARGVGSHHRPHDIIIINNNQTGTHNTDETASLVHTEHIQKPIEYIPEIEPNEFSQPILPHPMEIHPDEANPQYFPLWYNLRYAPNYQNELDYTSTNPNYQPHHNHHHQPDHHSNSYHSATQTAVA